MATQEAAQRRPTVGERVHEAISSTAAYRRFSDEDLESVYATATCFMAAGRFDKAQSLLVICCLYRMHEARYHLALGKCHRRLKQDEQAVQAFARAFAMDERQYDAALFAGECLLRLRRYDQARKVLSALVACAQHRKEAVAPATRARLLLELAGDSL